MAVAKNKTTLESRSGNKVLSALASFSVLLDCIFVFVGRRSAKWALPGLLALPIKTQQKTTVHNDMTSCNRLN